MLDKCAGPNWHSAERVVSLIQEPSFKLVLVFVGIAMAPVMVMLLAPFPLPLFPGLIIIVVRPRPSVVSDGPRNRVGSSWGIDRCGLHHERAMDANADIHIHTTG